MTDGADLNLTADRIEREDSPDLADIRAKAYSPTDDREKKRGLIALSLVAIMAIIVLAGLAEILLARAPDLDALRTVLELLFTPVVGLVGAVTGFYFGEKQGGR